MRLICRAGSTIEFMDALTDLVVVDLDDEKIQRIKRRAKRLILEQCEDEDVHSVSYDDCSARFYAASALDEYLDEHDPECLLDGQGYIVIDDDSELPESPGVTEEEEPGQPFPELEAMEVAITPTGNVYIYWSAYEGDMRIESASINLDDLLKSTEIARSES